MQFEKYYHRLSYLDELICKSSTGTPDQVAKKLGISRRMLFEYINLLKEKNAPIEYSRSRQSYFYSREWRLAESLTTILILQWY